MRLLQLETLNHHQRWWRRPQERFEKADADKSGKLSQQEFRPIALEMTLSLRSAVGEGDWEAAPSEPDLDSCFDMCDADGDGELDIFEFANLYAVTLESHTAQCKSAARTSP